MSAAKKLGALGAFASILGLAIALWGLPPGKGNRSPTTSGDNSPIVHDVNAGGNVSVTVGPSARSVSRLTLTEGRIFRNIPETEEIPGSFLMEADNWISIPQGTEVKELSRRSYKLLGNFKGEFVQVQAERGSQTITGWVPDRYLKVETVTRFD